MKYFFCTPILHGTYFALQYNFIDYNYFIYFYYACNICPQIKSLMKSIELHCYTLKFIKIHLNAIEEFLWGIRREKISFPYISNHIFCQSNQRAACSFAHI